MTVCSSDEERPREEKYGGNLRRSETRTAGQFVYPVDFPLVRRVSRVRNGSCFYPTSSPRLMVLFGFTTVQAQVSGHIPSRLLAGSRTDSRSDSGRSTRN
ncbi:hypothetical protein Hdeb2414_s0012g00388241 [Helianthus debilis subsp. tardiflorus]